MLFGMATSITTQSTPDTLVVRMKHARMVPCPHDNGYCVAGMQVFFKQHGMDFKHFLRHGLPASAFIETGDAQALELVRVAREAERNG